MAAGQKEYEHTTIVVVWKPELCQQSGNCIRALPEVFRPKDRPWILPMMASEGDVIEAVERCPSGALTWRKK